MGKEDKVKYINLDEELEKCGIKGEDLTFADFLVLRNPKWLNGDDFSEEFIELWDNPTDEFFEEFYIAVAWQNRYSKAFKEMDNKLSYIRQRFPRQEWSTKYTRYFMEVIRKIFHKSDFLVPKINEMLEDDPNLEYAPLRAIESFELPCKIVDTEAVAKYIFYNLDNLKQEDIDLYMMMTYLYVRIQKLNDEYPDYAYKLSKEEVDRLNAKYDNERSIRFRKIEEEMVAKQKAEEEKKEAQPIAETTPVEPANKKKAESGISENTFTYKLYDIEERNKKLQKVWSYLKVYKMIAQNTDLAKFFDIFSGKKCPKATICWTGKKAELAYFIKGILRSHAVTLDDPYVWNVVRCHFLDKDGKPFPDDLRSQHEPKKSKKHLDYIINLF